MLHQFLKLTTPLNQRNRPSKLSIACSTILFFLVASLVLGQEISSSSYIISEPIDSIGGYSTSTNFGLTSNISQIAIGPTLANSFKQFTGFLYFPFVTTPAVSAIAGDARVELAWTPADSGLGWTVSTYKLGQSTVSGGPYTFATLGNILNVTASNLSNGTRYYFVLQVIDSLGNVIATSTEVTALPAGSTTPPGGGGGTGGGGGSSERGNELTGVQLSGRAYPLSKVTILKDGQIAATTIAGPDANFDVELTGLSSGNYVFSVYSEDSKGNKSTSFSFPTTIKTGAFTAITGIFIAPTIDVDKSTVKKGDTISIFGQSVPNGQVTIAVNSEREFFNQAKTDKNGAYLYQFDTALLELGQHHAKSKALLAQAISAYGQPVGFTVGNMSILKKPSSLKGDLNADGRVNLVDFSIASYWYKRTLSKDFLITEGQKLNGDGKVDLIDFSIMAYYWTG